MSDTTGLSVGWFDPALLHHEPQKLIRGITRLLRPRLRRNRAWPLAVASVRAGGRGTGVAYALVGGHIPMHIDSVGLDDSDGRIFQFVLETANRPLLLATVAGDENTPVFMDFAPPTVKRTVALGGIEMKAGMAVHFDITRYYHGVSGMPVPMDTMQDDLQPRAVIVQVSGFHAAAISDAIAHAVNVIVADSKTLGL
jgi:hypothetical protein